LVVKSFFVGVITSPLLKEGVSCYVVVVCGFCSYIIVSPLLWFCWVKIWTSKL